MIPLFGHFPVYLLDPYSMFGRIFSTLIKPVFIGINNVSAGILEEIKIYSLLYPFNYKGGQLTSLIFPALLLAELTTAPVQNVVNVSACVNRNV